ncbi:GntR family transcriptional regulator [Naumannella halotolerans]|uniref:DNA-binding GntR family transcriptional regulator n=1 Tax=Naumannella halotolerans TaxID=993414 RepID=A0A4V3ENF8_9ACTN|nr:GntR family transcriptional regulator [Naumannella halotolerans]TDT33378.1 DNA-binding GntR family transcriptional regulator [Naumannella halotolerans]
MNDHETSIRPLEPRQSLRETVTERLRAAIISGEMSEGEMYSAPGLAAQLGVSATPVREAMVDLSAEGMVESVKNRGYRVTVVSDAELDELAQLRAMIEAPAVRQVAEAGPLAEPVQRELAGHADDIVTAARAGDLTGYLGADRAFHALLLEQFGNRQLVHLATALRSRTRMYGLRNLADEQLVASALEHQQLLDLIQADEPAAAEDLLRRHIGHARGLWAGTAAAPTGADAANG